MEGGWGVSSGRVVVTLMCAVYRQRIARGGRALLYITPPPPLTFYPAANFSILSTLLSEAELITRSSGGGGYTFFYFIFYSSCEGKWWVYIVVEAHWRQQPSRSRSRFVSRHASFFATSICFASMTERAHGSHNIYCAIRRSIVAN